MEARIAIVAPSDSFSEVWPQLASFAGAEIETTTDPAQLHSLHSACGVLVAAGGEERAAVSIVEELIAAHASNVVVAGVETNYRIVAALLQAGASDYFAMPADVGLCRTWFVERVERVEDRVGGFEYASDERHRFDFSKMIGESPQLHACLMRAARAIPRGRASILITGETGTGKELIARAVHFNSSRAAEPYVEINCTTLPENLLEAELFGYEAGAFTDARVAKPGLFEMAHRGTLFLDEIGDLPILLQAKLLRVIESGRVRRLGSVREVELDLRIVAATNVDLEAAIEAGKFRQDLYYRLNVVPIRLPALRDRGDDVLLIADYYLERFSKDYEVTPPELSVPARRALRTHSWPGNIRELRNAIERAILLGNGHIYTEDLFPDRRLTPSINAVLPFPASLDVIGRAAAKATVDRCGGNKSEAAKILGISRKHLYTLLRDGKEEEK